MKLEVPFYVQGINECGPATLQMVFEFLGEKHDREEIKKLIESESTGATWTIGLAKGSGQLGFKTELFSKSIGFNPENFDLEYYKKETDGVGAAEKKLKRLQAECIKYKVILEEKTLTLKEVLSKINENCVAVCLIDWYKVVNKEGYQGHFVPIVGYDEENVYIHQPGPRDPQAFLQMNKELFDKARQAKGTDEDILFIHRK